MNETPLLDPAAVAGSIIADPSASASAPAVAAPASEPSGPATPTPDGMVDAKGRVFDPTRFKARADGTPVFTTINNKQYFMPIGGRRRAEAVPAPAVSLPATPAAPTATPGPQIPAPEPVAAAPAWSEAEKAAAAAPAASAEPSSAAAPAPVEVIDATNDAAEVAARSIYFTLGIATGAPEETEPTKPEHAQLTKMVAAFLRARGWKGTVTVCIFLAVAAYLMRVFSKPKASAKLHGWLGQLWRAKRPPAPVAAPVQSSPAPAESTKPSAPAPAFSSLGGFSERAG